MNDEQRKPERLLRINQVEELVGLKKTSIYELVKLGQMPAAVRITGRAVAWRESEIAIWQQGRQKTRGE